MALEIRATTAFERDLQRVRKQGKDLDKLEAVVNISPGARGIACAVPSTCLARELVGTLGVPRAA